MFEVERKKKIESLLSDYKKKESYKEMVQQQKKLESVLDNSGCGNFSINKGKWQ